MGEAEGKIIALPENEPLLGPRAEDEENSEGHEAPRIAARLHQLYEAARVRIAGQLHQLLEFSQVTIPARLVAIQQDMRTLYGDYGRWVAKNPFLVLLLSLAPIIVLCFGCIFLQLDLEEGNKKTSDVEWKDVISIYVIVYVVMIGYLSFTFGDIPDLPNICISSMVFLGFSGVVLVVLSILGSIGLLSFLKFKSTSILLKVMPSLVLAVGLDNMYLLFEAVKKVPLESSLEERISDALYRVGPLMLLASFSQIIAFAIGALIPKPTCLVFSLCAALAVALLFVLQGTAFISSIVLVIDHWRAEDNPPSSGMNSNSEAGFLDLLMRETYAPFLGRRMVKVIVIVLFLAFALVSLIPINLYLADIWGTALMNIVIALGAIFIVSLIITFSFWISGFIFLVLLMIVIDLMGIMAILKFGLKISLNEFSTMNLTLSIGIAVQFCVHIVYSFLVRHGDKYQRMQETLGTVGVSVFSEITSMKMIPLLVLIFLRSEVIEIYFLGMYMVLVVVALMHGLVFLPVLLSVFSPAASAGTAALESSQSGSPTRLSIRKRC